MLPPGLLERLELVAERTPDGARRAAEPRRRSNADLLEQLAGGPAAGPRPRRARWPGRARCAACGRSRRGGVVDLDWTLLGAGGGPRYERWIAADRRGPGRRPRRSRPAERPPGGRSGRARSTRSRSSPAGDRPAGVPAARVWPAAPRHGSAASPASSGAGSSTPEVRERPRRPLAGRPAGRRGGRPAGERTSLPAQAEAVEPIRDRDRPPATRRPLLLDGVTGGGKTAIYVEAIAGRSTPAGRRSCSSRRSRWRCRWSTGCAPTSTRGSRSSTPGLGDGERADEWRRIRARRRRHRRRDAARGRSRRSPTSGSSSSTRSTTRPTRATGRRGSRPATSRSGWPRWPVRRVVLGSATPAVDSVGRARIGRLPTASCCRRARSGSRPTVEVVDLRAELAAGNRGLLSRPLADGARRPRHRRRRAGDPRPQPARHARRSCCAATAATSRPARTASGRSSTTRPGRRCAATTAAGRRRSRRAARPARSPRIRYLGGGTERVEREVRDRFPGLRVGRLDRDVVERRGAAERVIDAFAGRPDRRPRRDEPRDQGPRHPGGHARRGRLGRRRAQPARRARRRADVPAPRPGGRPGRPRRPARAARSSRPTSPSIRRSVAVATGDADGVLRRGARPARAVRVAAVRPAGQADRRPGRPRRGRARGPRDGRPAPRAGRRSAERR